MIIKFFLYLFKEPSLILSWCVCCYQLTQYLYVMRNTPILNKWNTYMLTIKKNIYKWLHVLRALFLFKGFSISVLCSLFSSLQITIQWCGLAEKHQITGTQIKLLCSSKKELKGLAMPSWRLSLQVVTWCPDRL